MQSARVDCDRDLLHCMLRRSGAAIGSGTVPRQFAAEGHGRFAIQWPFSFQAPCLEAHGRPLVHRTVCQGCDRRRGTLLRSRHPET